MTAAAGELFNVGLCEGEILPGTVFHYIRAFIHNWVSLLTQSDRLHTRVSPRVGLILDLLPVPQRYHVK